MQELNVKELEKQLAEAKLQESKNKWQSYLQQCETFLKSIVGKCIIKWHSNGGFVIFKIGGYKEQYYFGKDKNPERYFELEIEGCLSAKVADNMGKWYRPQLNDIKSFKYFTIDKLSKIEFADEKIEVEQDTRDVRFFGREQYEGKKELRADLTISDFCTFAYFVDEEVYNAMKDIHHAHINSIKRFWLKYEETIKQSKHI